MPPDPEGGGALAVNAHENGAFDGDHKVHEARSRWRLEFHLMYRGHGFAPKQGKDCAVSTREMSEESKRGKEFRNSVFFHGSVWEALRGGHLLNP